MRYALCVFLFSSSAFAADWDSLAGGLNGNQLRVDVGFSELPGVEFDHQLVQHFSIGAAVAFDYAYWTPVWVFTPGIQLSIPMRVKLYERGRASLGLKFQPGFLLEFTDPFQFAVLLNVGFNGGAWITRSFLLGGGLDVPIAVRFPPNGYGAYGAIPLLFGPFFEFHPSELFGLTFDVKLGPNINTVGGVSFALKALLGFAFHF